LGDFEGQAISGDNLTVRRGHAITVGHVSLDDSITTSQPPNVLVPPAVVFFFLPPRLLCPTRSSAVAFRQRAAFSSGVTCRVGNFSSIVRRSSLNLACAGFGDWLRKTSLPAMVTRLPGDAGVPVIYRNRRARPIDKHLLARLVLLTQNHIELRAPRLRHLRSALRYAFPREPERHFERLSFKRFFAFPRIHQSGSK
jgi:hypothetical protein